MEGKQILYRTPGSHRAVADLLTSFIHSFLNNKGLTSPRMLLRAYLVSYIPWRASLTVHGQQRFLKPTVHSGRFGYKILPVSKFGLLSLLEKPHDTFADLPSANPQNSKLVLVGHSNKFGFEVTRGLPSSLVSVVACTSIHSSLTAK